MKKNNWQWYTERLNAIGFKNYNEYLKSAHWVNQKEKFYALQEKPYHCFICGDYNKSFNVHHRSYKRVGMENLKSDLILLCRDCHKLVHEMQDKLTTKFWDIPRILKKNLLKGKPLKFK